MVKVYSTEDHCSGCGATPSFEIEIGHDCSGFAEKFRMCTKCIENFQTALGLAKTQAAPEANNNEEAWHKVHKLFCKIDYLVKERDSKPEQVSAKYAWDMILLYILRELTDLKAMLMEKRDSDE